MSKNPLNIKVLKKIVRTTQMLEGYQEAPKKVQEEVKSIREKYGIKVQKGS